MGEALVVEFPRSDLNVLVAGVVLDPGLVQACRFTFHPLAEGARLEGEWVFLEREIPRVLEELEARGFRVHSILSPLLKGSPGLRLVGTSREGDGPRMARDLLRVLGEMGIPLESPMAPPSAPGPENSEGAWGTWEALQSHLGPGILLGGLLEFNVVRSPRGSEGIAALPLELRLRFQRSGGDVACAGEIHLSPEGVPGILKDLARGGIGVAALGPGTAPGKGALASLRIFALGPAEGIGKTFQGILEGKD
jgi:hypothetical protein